MDPPSLLLFLPETIVQILRIIISIYGQCTFRSVDIYICTIRLRLVLRPDTLIAKGFLVYILALGFIKVNKKKTQKTH